MAGRAEGHGRKTKDRDLYPIPEARERLGGISHGFFYNLVKAGEIKITKLGRRSFVTGNELRRLSGDGDGQ